MGYFFYILLYILLRTLALIPLRVLYLFSSLLYFIQYYVIGYRKKIVSDNVRQAFPDKPEAELKRIIKDTYKNQCDVIVEIISMNGIFRKRILKRVTIHNNELLDSIYEKRQPVVAVCAHHGNWELPTLFPPYIKHLVLGVYKPLSIKSLDLIMQHNRALFGAVPTSINDLWRKIMECKQKDIPSFIYLLADQRPQAHMIEHWLPFFGRTVPVVVGPDKISRKLNCPVVYMNVVRRKRGYYDVHFSLLCDKPAALPKYEVMKLYYEKLEQCIREQPAPYMWSHNRWKIVKENQPSQGTDQK